MDLTLRAADPIARLCTGVGKQQHRALVVWAATWRNSFKVSVAGFVFAEQPIDGPVSRDALNRLAVLDLQPFVEQAIECSGAATVAVDAAGRGVVIAERFIRDSATGLPVARRDVEIESGRAVGQ